MWNKLFALGAVAALAVPVGAQQAVPAAPATPSPEEAQLRVHVATFELALRGAVENGGQRLAQWAFQVVPTVGLALAASPTARGVPLPDDSLYFDVQIPEILQTSIMLWSRYVDPQTGNARTVAQGRGGRVGATGRLVDDDPMLVSAAESHPNVVYGEFVRQALIDAMLDSSGLLPVGDDQWLTVAASGVDVAVRNPLYRNQSRKLILSIRGEDLRAFRAQELTRDEVLMRIKERRF